MGLVWFSFVFPGKYDSRRSLRGAYRIVFLLGIVYTRRGAIVILHVCILMSPFCNIMGSADSIDSLRVAVF